MIDKNELLLVVDELNNPAKPLPRHIVHNQRIWHRATGIWVINAKKQILCQKRSMKKDLKPGFWEAFFGGHLHPGDTYDSNAITELSEELGIQVKKDNLIPYKIFKSDKQTHKEFQHSFVYILDQKKTDFHFEKEEIDEIRWYDLDEVKHFLLEANDPYWVHKSWDDEMLAFIAQLS
jgi:isopentenyl-diphosphate Delta-isomerase